jgi:3-oxoacyl-[acyl-carrier protein] reductase
MPTPDKEFNRVALHSRIMVCEDLVNKCVLVTGSSRGIGREMVKQFHAHGSLVALNYNTSENDAKKVKVELGSRIEIFRADVSKQEDVNQLVRRVIDRFGKVDILVNNAGIIDGSRFDEFRQSSYDRLWGTNFMGTVYVSLAVVKDMKKRHHGSIINLSSNLGMGAASSGATYYAVSKTALISLTKRMAHELGTSGIRVNAIAPGWIRTDMTMRGLTPQQIKKSEETIRSHQALDMIGEPEHIAKLALFLGSDDSALITGQVIVADGGRMDYLSHAF